MFLEWWMIGVLSAFWIYSVINHGQVSFRNGAEAVMAGLHEEGYIKFDKDGEIVGLCNSHKYRNDEE